MKIKIVLATVTLVSVLSACKKDYTCECTTSGSSTYVDSQGNVDVFPHDPSTTTVTYTKVKKSQLGFLCGDSKSTSSSNTQTTENGGMTSSSSGSIETKCKIK